MERFLIIADDFTGANDTGVQFTKKGINTRVVFDGASDGSNGCALVIDTETRGMSGQEAYERVKSLCKTVQADSFTCVYKKVDSTLRGNICEEIKAVYEIYMPELIIFAPAYPSNHRITVNGIQYVNGIPVSVTEAGCDPKKPVDQDNITTLLHRAISEQITHVSLDQIRNGCIDLSKGKAFTFDAEEKEDLIRIAESVKRGNKKTLWIGSAGLADAIMQATIPGRPVLSVIGSISEVSRNQNHYAASKGTAVINADIAGIFKGDDISCAVNETVKNLEERKDVILVSGYNRQDYEECIKLAARMGMTKEEMSTFAQLTLGRIAAEALKQVKVAGLFLSGGDTAIEVIRKLGAYGSVILREMAEGIPLIKLQGGPFDGLYAVTKAGAFGETETLDYCIKKLKEVF